MDSYKVGKVIPLLGMLIFVVFAFQNCDEGDFAKMGQEELSSVTPLQLSDLNPIIGLVSHPTPSRINNDETLTFELDQKTKDLGLRHQWVAISLEGVSEVIPCGDDTFCTFTMTLGYDRQNISVNTYLSEGEFKRSNSVYITLQNSMTEVAPAVSISPVLYVVAAGNRLVVTAMVTGNPAPTLVWQKDMDGQLVSLSNTSATLIFDSAKPGEAGRYKLSATNSLGVSSQEIAIDVTTNGDPLPQIALNAVSDLNISPGDALIFNISVTDGSTGPFYYKLVKGATVANGVVVYESLNGYSANNKVLNFEIANAQSADAGNYWVVFANYGGVVSHKIAVTVDNLNSRKCPSGSTPSEVNNQLVCTQHVTATATWTSLDLSGGYEFCNYKLVENFTGGCGNIAAQQAYSGGGVRYYLCTNGATTLISKRYGSCKAGLSYKSISWDKIPSTYKNFNFSGYKGTIHLSRTVPSIPK